MLQPLANQPLIGALMVLLCLALVSDLRSRRIPNRLIVYGLIIGLVGNAWVFGWSGCLFAIGGAAVGLLCLLPFYMTGSMGAGDAKLMAMCGSFLGPVVVAVAAAASLVAGGVIGIALFWHHHRPEAGSEDGLNSNGTSVTHAGELRSVPTIPYAFAIAAGVLMALAALPQISAVFEGAF